MTHATTFMGYHRPDGHVGIRNYVIAVGNCSCSNGIVNQIAAQVPGVIPMIHTDGCSTPRENERWRETLIGVCCNPNVYAAIIIGVGCETDDAKEIGKRVEKESNGKPVFAAVVQQDGGGRKVIEAAVEAAKKFVADAEKVERKEAPVSKLILATECGGSDAFSGITANPAIGYVSDWIVANGGTSILSEIPELFGTEEILARRSITPEVGQKVKNLIYEWEERTRSLLGENTGRALARGNMEGGLTTIQEKALGCVHKGGTSTVMDVIDYPRALIHLGKHLCHAERNFEGAIDALTTALRIYDTRYKFGELPDRFAAAQILSQIGSAYYGIDQRTGGAEHKEQGLWFRGQSVSVYRKALEEHIRFRPASAEPIFLNAAFVYHYYKEYDTATALIDEVARMRPADDPLTPRVRARRASARQELSTSQPPAQ